MIFNLIILRKGNKNDKLEITNEKDKKMRNEKLQMRNERERERGQEREEE